MKVLVTGAAGFIGDSLVKYLLTHTDHTVICIDDVSEISNKSSIFCDEKRNDRIIKLKFNLCDFEEFQNHRESLCDCDIILHLAADTHVDRSIADPRYTITNNVMSTLNLLEFYRGAETLSLFVYFSTDEIFGPSWPGKSFKVDDRHHASNPYSASKSASESLCVSYNNTYKIPLLITRCVNVFGENQHPEKFVNKIIDRLANNLDVHVHCNDDTIGSRFYIYADDVVHELMMQVYKFIEEKQSYKVYHISSNVKLNNDDVVRLIASEMGIDDYKLNYIQFDEARPGHDLTYDIDNNDEYSQDKYDKVINQLKQVVKNRCFFY